MRIALIVAIALAAQAATAAEAPKRPAAAKLTTSEFARSFVCPEALPNDARREQETKRFLDWVAAVHPNWTPADMVEHRMALLVAHGCHQTLQSIQQAGQR